MKQKMATYHGSGCQSPPTIGRTVDRIFEDAQFTGEIYLNGRKLRDYPKLCSKYDLSDTTLVDISRNRLTEVPHEVCEYLFVEKINCYHNVIRSIPENIQQLQVLTHLILSRNQMTVLPPALCMLGCLEVLHVSNNKLVSLPEEIRHLTSLMDLDVSCNELSHLPVQIGDLSSLRSLNLRRNFLVELPVEISRLQLYKLDFSSNRIEKIPTVFRKMQTLEQFILDNNPLTLPPAYICIKGRQHIMKFLHIEAIKEDRKRGILMGSDSDMKKFIRKSLPPPQSSDDLKNMLGGAESKWKRHTVLSNDSGYSTTDGSERNGWQSGEIYPLSEENNNCQPEMGKKYRDHLQQTYFQSYQPHHQQQTEHFQHNNQTTASSAGSHVQPSRPRSGTGLQQTFVPSVQRGDTYPEPVIPGRTSPAHISTSYPQYQQRQYHQDVRHSQLNQDVRHSKLNQDVRHSHLNQDVRHSQLNQDVRHSQYHPHVSLSSVYHPHTSAMYSSSYSSSISTHQTPSPASISHSSDSQPMGHNTSFSGSDSGVSLTRQRSNTSLSDYQPRQYTGSSAHTAQRAYSPAGFTRYRSDSPTPRYGNSKPPVDYSTNNPLSALSSHAADSHHRESLPRDRNAYQLPSRLERMARESPPRTSPTPSMVMSGNMEDEFTRELKRQKAEYERKKKQAEIIRVQQEEEEEEREKEERRRAALKLQEDQKMIMQKQEEQRKHDEFQKQEELRRQEELKLIEGKRRKEEDESQTRDEDIQKLHDTVRIQEGEQIRMKGNTDKRAESKLLDKNNLINNGVAENSHQSSTSTTPSVSPSPSPRNSVSHLAKPNSPSSSTSHLAKPISPSGSTSHLVKPTGTKSAVPRAANGPAGPAQSQAVRKTKLAGDRSNTASPVTARSARTAAPGGLRTQGSGLSSAPSNLRRSSNSSIIDDEPKPRKGPTGAPVETSRLKAHLDEHNKKGTPLHTSAGKKSDHPPESVDTNKRVNTRPPTSTNIYGLGRGRPGIGGPKTLEDSSSNFTTHKKEEKEEAEQMDRLRQMVESRLRVTLPDNLAEALRDGVVLCHLANHVRPRSVGSIHVPSPAVPKLTLAKCRRNVDNFLDACKKIGVDQEQLCGPQDIFDEKGISRVAITVAALVAVGSSPRQSAV
ncbi:hypothetical protein BsWGS_03991 [Bradybaena similaris]